MMEAKGMHWFSPVNERRILNVTGQMKVKGGQKVTSVLLSRKKKVTSEIFCF